MSPAFLKEKRNSGRIFWCGEGFEGFMYLLSLVYANAGWNGSGRFSLLHGSRVLKKWTVLDAHEQHRELLRLVAISCSGPAVLSRLSLPLKTLRGGGKGPLRVEHLRFLHHAVDTSKVPGIFVTSALQVSARGKVAPLYRFRGESLFEDHVFCTPRLKALLRRDFLLAYGENFSAYDGGDDFDFSDPLFRSRRFLSIFSDSVPLTDPVAFLGRLFYRGARNKRLGPLHILERTCLLLQGCFGLEFHHWLESPAEADEEWRKVPLELHTPLLPLLDAARHVLDAHPKMKRPLDAPGLILLDRPDRYCTGDSLTGWLSFFDNLFPNMQFVATIPSTKWGCIPSKLLEKELSLPLIQQEKAPRRAVRPSSLDVLLIDVDGRLPNLALMKLSRHFKEQGREVRLARGQALVPSAREVYASCIFTSPASRRKVKALQDYYGDSLQLGGSGIDIRRRLPDEIEKLPPDYGLYPELEDRALGFLSRGCPLQCPFCIVALKEGPPRQVCDLDSLTEGGRRKKLILLDDNLLSLPHSEELLQEIFAKEIMVNFTQTLDLRFVNRNKAALLRRIHCANTRFTRTNYHFSLNGIENLPLVRERYELFGFTFRDNAEFVCMYGYNTSLAEDVERFRFLRTLPGAYVFVQRYQPVPGGPPPDNVNFFEGEPDRLIDELIAIDFTQNMKSMEKYYRWISRLYAETFGRLHMPLVDKIFRYNNRERRGLYIATLAGLKPYDTP